jgi:hypothetical protein
MLKEPEIRLNGIKIGPYSTWASVCYDGYSLSDTPVPGFDNSEVLAKINEYQPLISTDGNYQNEILKSVFNVGTKTNKGKPSWIIPKSIRQRSFGLKGDNRAVVMAGEVSPVDRTLHRQFVSLLDKDIKQKLKFANNYGLLKRNNTHNIVFKNPHTGQQVQMGESLLWWQEEISRLASCLKLWDMVLHEDKKIYDYILWHRDGITIRLENEETQLINRANINLLDKWEKSDTVGPVLYFISLEMEKRLTNALTLQISASVEKEIFLYPDTLLSAIWLMFLLEIGGGSRPMRCEMCGDFFSTQDPRARFCSTRCRMRNYRNRKSQELISQKTVINKIEI